MRGATFCWLIVFTSVQAQPLPQLTVLQPPGGKAGTTVHLVLTGVDLEEVESLMITPGGITAERTPDPAKPGAILPNQFTLQIPKEVAPGTYDVRAVNAYGITNPRAFVVGELAELAEKEPNNDVHQAQAIPLQSTISGHIANPTDVDYFSIECQQGQTIILECIAESMDSQLYPDIRVFTKSGKMIAANRPRSVPDGYCHFTAPETATYVVRLCSHAHLLGGPEAFYRLSISTRPWIEAITPAIVEPGKTREAFLWGRNLPGGSLDPNFRAEGQPLQKLNIQLTSPPAEAAAQQLEGFAWLPPRRTGLDGFAYRIQNMQGWSNQIPITFSSDNLILAHGTHNSPVQAQPLTLPCDVLGRIERVNDRDWYSFTAQAGQTLAMEAFADRLGIPVDLYFEIRNEQGGLLAEFDDHTDVSNYHRFASRTDDPVARFTAPADGKYFLIVSSRDATLRADPRLQYHLAIHEPRPDFRLVVVEAHPSQPGALRLLAGGRQHLDLVLYRRDGFQGEVECTVEGLPEGIQVTSAIIPAGASTGALLLTASDKLPAWNGVITVLAHATIAGKKITRQARAGCLVWPNPLEQNNHPGISRWCRSTVLAARPGTPALRISLPEAPMALPAGGASNLLVKLERLNPDAKVPVTISPVHLPPGVLFNNNQPLVLAADKAEQEVRLQVPAAVVAEKFPVILRAVAQVPFAKDPAAKQKPAVLTSETSNAMVVQVYRQVVKWKNPPATVEITPEQESKLSIELLREQNYQGPVTVQIQGLPAGVSINSAAIPEKIDQSIWNIKATKHAQTKPEGVPIMVRFTGVVNGVNLVTEHTFRLIVKK